MGAPSSPVTRSGTGDEGAPIPFSSVPPKWEKLDPGLNHTYIAVAYVEEPLQ